MTLYIPGFTEVTLAETYRIRVWTASQGCHGYTYPYIPPHGWSCDPSYPEVNGGNGSHGGCTGCIMTELQVIANYQTEVTFVTDPIGARIFIDGVEWWPGAATALDGATFRGIPPAADPTPHTYELRKTGYASATGTFQVMLNTITTVTETLQQPFTGITIQNVTIGGIPCMGGCTITCTTICPASAGIIVTWANSGNVSGTFTPTVTVGIQPPISGLPITVTPGGTGVSTFLGVILQEGPQSICFDSGIVT